MKIGMKHFYTYGTQESSFESFKKDRALIFSVELLEHESGWWGIYAKGKTSQIDEIKLYPNFVEGEGYHLDDGGYIYLLSISCSISFNEIPKLVESSAINFQLVRHHKL